MKKLALALIAASALILGFGTMANAQGYGPGIAINPVNPTAGGPYSVVYQNCTVGETITFTQPQSTPTSTTAVCASPGTATGVFSAGPSGPGTYTVRAVGTTSPEMVMSFGIGAPAATVPGSTVPAVVPGGGLPATGSGGLGTTSTIAIGLLIVGLGLFVVARVRRRQAAII